MRRFILGCAVGAIAFAAVQQQQTARVDETGERSEIANAGSACGACPGDINMSGEVDLFDLLDLIDNWGECGPCKTHSDCGPNEICVAGNCVCAPGYADCDGDPCNGCEVNLQNDVNNCGFCGSACGSGLSCVNGTCQTISCINDDDCPDGFYCDSGTCVLQLTEGSPCTGTNQCLDGLECIDGICTAP